MKSFDKIYTGDALEVLRTLPDNSVHCGVTRLREDG
jgi:DNA modification methylase